LPEQHLKKIFKLTTFSFLGPLLATFFIVLFILLMQFLWTYIDDLVGKGLEWYVIVKLLFFASASFVPAAFPLAILLSSIMAFGKLSETYELVALKSAGISLIRAMVPLISLVFFLSVCAFFFSNNVIPRANLKFRSLLWDIRQQRPALDIQEGVFYGGIDNYSIRVGKKDKNSQHIQNIMIYDHSNNRADEIVMTAKSGEMATTKDKRWLILTLNDGSRFEELPNNRCGPPSFPMSRLNFKTYEIKFDLSGFNLNRTKEELFKDNYQMLNISQLQYYQDSLERLRNKKVKEIKDYSRPYFAYLRDTAIYKSKNWKSAAALPAGEAFTASLPRRDQHDVTLRSLNTARTLKEVFRVQGEELDNYDKQSVRYRMEWHRKFALSLACLTLFFIGAPLGAIIRKGGIGMPTVVAIVMFIIFYIISIMGEKSAKEEVIGVFIGMWIPTLVLLPIGLFLTWRANIDRMNFSASSISHVMSVIRKWLPGRFNYSSKDEDSSTY
jgi:lipopolysaccharide export system permease protein